MQKNRYWNRFKYPAPRRFLSRNCCRKSAVMTFRSSSTAAFASSSNAPSSESPSGSSAKPGSKPRLTSLRCAAAGLAAKSSSSTASSKSIGTRAKPSASRAPRSLRARDKKKGSALGDGSFGAKNALVVGLAPGARSVAGAIARRHVLKKPRCFAQACYGGPRKSPRARGSLRAVGDAHLELCFLLATERARLDASLAVRPRRDEGATDTLGYYPRPAEIGRLSGLTHYSLVLSSPTHREPPL